MNLEGIEGKVALVTGAAQGIGEAVVRILAGLGAVVAAVDVNAAGLDKLTAELTAEGLKVKAYCANVSDSRAVEDTVNRVEAEQGPIGILANVAGILRTGLIESFSDEDWAAVFAVNTTGVFYVSRAVAKRMAIRRQGAIVTVGSNAAAVPRIHMAAYAASKAASAMFTKCLGLEHAANHIRCNVVSPGSTDTAMQRDLWQDANGEQAVITGSPDLFKLGIPLGRIAEPGDIAKAVAFLASDNARHITMHDLRIDGGATLGS
jgi:2,3-dihydro-2,3-dihydroxybenzoate dehydrogenase